MNTQTFAPETLPQYERHQLSTVEMLMQRYMAFPEITYAEFLELPEDLRREIIQKNHILQTDTYNRTMGYIKGEAWSTPETYVMQMRKGAEGYLIVHGIRAQIEKIARTPVNRAELDFAVEYYAQANVPFFNQDMWEMVLNDYDGYLPLAVDCVPDGTAILPGDPVMRVSGPGELAAHFEPSLHRIFYESLVATTAHEIAMKVGTRRFIEVGKRGTPNEEMHLAASVAMYDGGGINMTSNDAAAAAYPELKDIGTLGHRFVQFYETEEQAFENAVLATEATSLLIDLVNSEKGIEKALELKTKYRHTGKKIWIRLDSGNITALTLYTLQRYKELGFTDPMLDKVVVEDLSVVEDMVEIDRMVDQAGYSSQDFVTYGAGGLLVTKMKERNSASTGYKLSEVDGQPKMKFSDSPGKESIPGQPTIVITADGERIIAQEGEYPDAEDLFVPAYRPGIILLQEDRAQTRAIVEQSYARIAPYIGTHTPRSPETLDQMQSLHEHYFVES